MICSKYRLLCVAVFAAAGCHLVLPYETTGRDAAIDAALPSTDGGPDRGDSAEQGVEPPLPAFISSPDAIVHARNHHRIAAFREGFAVSWIQQPVDQGPDMYNQSLGLAVLDAGGSVVMGPTTIELGRDVRSIVALLAVEGLERDSLTVIFRGASDPGAQAEHIWTAFADVIAGEIAIWPPNKIEGSDAWIDVDAVHRPESETVHVIASEPGTCAGFPAQPTLFIQEIDADSATLVGTRTPVHCVDQYQWMPRARWLGENLVVVWNFGWHIGYALLDANLALVGQGEISSLGAKSEITALRIATDGADRVLLAWRESNVREAQLCLQRAENPGGVTLERCWAEPISLTSVDKEGYPTRPEIADGPGQVAIAWHDDQNVLGQIRFAKVDLRAPAAPLNLNSVALTTAPYNFLSPRVARGSGSYGVAFVGMVQGQMGLFFEGAR